MSKPSGIDEKKMIKVSKELFTDGLPLPAEVYTRLPSGQFILVGRKADTGNLSNLHLMQEKQVDLFVREEEYNGVVTFNVNLIEKTLKNDSVNPVLKMNLLKGVAESTISELTKKDVYVGSFDRCKQIVGFVQETVVQIKDFDKFLDIFSKLPGDLVSHSLATSVVSLMICEQMDITMKSTLEKVVMGAYLHDIGLKEIPLEILNKPRLQWTEAEVHYYESHPLRGVEILRDIKEIPSDVLGIVLEHHENALGMGFPRRIRDIKINPLARIVAVADCFVDLIYENNKEGARRTPEEAVAYIENIMGQPYNKPAFLALKKIIHLTHVQKKLKGTG
ncbi:HD-GYP domain-containing protein [Bdellovibrio sp. HCB337]|uniref:HD-GYP domain-containing protein n=1 Tax=Bdellovibrio sp. HCB337 TaxID=3394358 RepID=UPI0039A5BD47